MNFGCVFPKSDPLKAIEFAKEAEKCGWNGFFVWEPIYGADAWVTLSAIASQTKTIKLGTLISPLSRMRPWKIASEVLTLDIISRGRVILAVALGALDTGFAEFGEVTERKTRAELLDEALEIITNFWKGEYTYSGKHYDIKECTFFQQVPPPKPIQKELPIWVVGAWPRTKSLKRTMKYAGILPNVLNERNQHEEVTPKHIQKIREFMIERIEEKPFDIVVEGTTSESSLKAKETVLPFKEAGATWWIESQWMAESLDEVLNRIKAGPPM
ncbi:MAG: LLM class flavin-dependent oxidoreductase [Candidatus Thorarchaeota archaeon]